MNRENYIKAVNYSIFSLAVAAIGTIIFSRVSSSKSSHKIEGGKGEEKEMIKNKKKGGDITVKDLKDFQIEKILHLDDRNLYIQGQFPWQRQKGSRNIKRNGKDKDNDDTQFDEKELETSLIKCNVIFEGLQVLIKRSGETTSTSRKPSISNEVQCTAQLLNSLHINLRLNSGAQYGYYNGFYTPPSSFSKQIYNLFQNILNLQSNKKMDTDPNPFRSCSSQFNIEIISPANKKDILRCLPTQYVLVAETPELYQTKVKSIVNDIVGDGNSLQWIYNILNGEKEVERTLFEDSNRDEGFILSPNPKWTSHKDLTPEQFEEMKNCMMIDGMEDKEKMEMKRMDYLSQIHFQKNYTKHLNCLALVHRRDIASLRDLSSQHLPLLHNLKKKGTEAIEKIYGVKSNEIVIFIHYHPQFYHFHVHFGRLGAVLKNNIGVAWLLEDVIDRITENGNFFQEKATIYCQLDQQSALYKKAFLSEIHQKEEEVDK